MSNLDMAILLMCLSSTVESVLNLLERVYG